MQLIIVAIISSFIVLLGISQLKKDSEVSVDNYIATNAKNVANNIIAYTTAVKQYAIISGERDVVIDNSKLDTTLAKGYSYRELVDYSSVIVVDQSTDIRYIIVSWDSSDVTPVKSDAISGELSRISNQPKNVGASSWVVPILIDNQNNCDGVIINRYVTPVNKLQTGYQNLFNSLCTQSQSRLNFNLKKYALLIQIVD